MLVGKVRILLCGAAVVLGHVYASEVPGSVPGRPDGAVDCTEPHKGGPADVVRALYRKFPWDGEKAIQNEPRHVLSNYFNEELTGLLVSDYECRAREQGICRMDFALLYYTQDPEISDLRFCSRGVGNTSVDVRFKNSGVWDVVGYEMVRTQAGWRISDVRYRDGSTLIRLLKTPM